MVIKKETLFSSKGFEIFKPFKEGNYEMPTEVIFARDFLLKVSRLPIVKKSQKIGLISGDHFKNTETFRNLLSTLNKCNKKIVIYPEKIISSDIKTVNDLTNFCRYENFEIILAIGGGTILDTAKCAAVLAKNDGIVEDYIIKKTKILNNKSIDLLAIPTTAGTGSEVTPWATVWDTKKKKKYSLASPLIFPKLAVVDPQLTDSLPAVITAETGMDALAQAIESYWSKNNNPISDVFSLASIKLCINNLEKAATYPDKTCRDKMAKASMLAGLAFSNTQTTICHAVSYPITAHFNISHGQAVAVTLPDFFKFFLEVIAPERKGLLLKAIGETTIYNAAKKIKELMKRIGIKTKLSDLGIKGENIDLIVNESFSTNRADNSPKVPTLGELKKILEKI